MTDISKFVEDCDTIRSFFEKVESSKLRVHSVTLRTGDEGFITLKVKDDYALIHRPGDGFDRSIREAILVHPYGASIGYSFENPDY